MIIFKELEQCVEQKKTLFVGTGIIFGFTVGLIINLIIFDQINSGGPFGKCFEIIIGDCVDGFEKKKSASRKLKFLNDKE